MNWPNLVNDKNIEHVKQKLNTCRILGRQFFKHFHQVYDKSIRKVCSFPVELIVANFYAFETLIYNCFVHDIGCDLINHLGILFRNCFLAKHWKLMYMIQILLTLSWIFKWRKFINTGWVFYLLRKWWKGYHFLDQLITVFFLVVIWLFRVLF